MARADSCRWAHIIWLPAQYHLITTSSIWKGVTILITGGVVISFIDNNPVLVGRETKMPDAIVLFMQLSVA